MKREQMPSGQSKALFTNTAQRVHPKNSLHSGPMRGGIRL